MELTRTERLLLFNQYRILELLDPRDKTHAQHAEILARGYTRLYPLELFRHIGEETSPEVCDEVTEVLQLFRLLQNAYQDLRDKPNVAGGAIQFEGFDGNEEGAHYGYASFMIEDLGRWSESRLESLNSHCPRLPKYRRMIEAWKACEAPQQLTARDVLRIVDAGKDH